MRAALRQLVQHENDPEILLLGTSLGTLFSGLVWLKMGLPVPGCAFHALTGVPCPTCGATRCLVALLHGHAAEALAFNPLAFFSICAIVLANAYAAVVVLGGFPRMRLVMTPLEKQSLFPAFSTITLLNWVYLIAHRV